MEKIVEDWRKGVLGTKAAAELILKRLACSSMSMFAIMKAVNELPEQLINAMR